LAFDDPFITPSRDRYFGAFETFEGTSRIDAERTLPIAVVDVAKGGLC